MASFTPIRSLATQATTTTTKVVARTRPLPARKSVLFASHLHLLQSNPLVLFLRPGDFSAQEYRQLRAAISALPLASPDSLPPAKPKLTVLRPGLLPALLRHPSLQQSKTTQLNTSYLSSPSHLKGPLAVLTASSLSPTLLNSLLPILSQFSSTPSPNAPPLDPKAKNSTPTPERLQLLSGLFEGTKALDEQATAQVAKLPELDVLRAQIVGLLTAPGARITGVLGQRAFEVARTLEGLKAGLEEEEAKVEA
ncbi:hypothetical protein BCR35DRAFT_310608 [Leucosporidium creatinivorum]|uniref:Uncharacterized protein n=1 Tax=Leucosporidium creatinivorum TaxID=106004 RepID=A0A1Y2D0R4_9BASI|nr:hypothetical protein BCR35DRAFT_310608 [Leucosporidium creatinivorum]